MIIDCPNCAKKYILPSGIIAAPSFRAELPSPTQYGWTLSCAKCNYQWWQPCEIARVLDNNFSTQDNAVLKPFTVESSPIKAGRNFPTIFSLISILIISLSLGGVGYLYRQPLKSFWYQLIGKPIPFNAQPFSLKDVRYNLTVSSDATDDNQILTLEGNVVNPNTFPMQAPVLRISVWAECHDNPNETKSSFNDCLYLEWLYRPASPQIEGLKELPFQTSYPISAKVKRIEVSIS